MCVRETMDDVEDLRLARAILAKGWAAKEVLQEALGAVARLRSQDPELTLYQYLETHGIVSRDRLEEVREAGGRQPASPARPQAHAQPQPGAQGEPHAQPGPCAQPRPRAQQRPPA